ncbi:MAG: 1,4-dihydroxy-2-naphthoate polyprenyltransferase [Actinomycetota bacterium]|nr:1,4-dihydroxy-2-naphthoate polyprenyltransferase [Actinomycetota bacterium]
MSLWVQGARPRTLTVSIVPVIVGCAAAGRFAPVRLVLLLIVALGMQVGVNYANDYSDGVRGVDTVERRGPVRLTASGLKAPRAVLAASLLSFLAAAIAGGVLAMLTSWWLLLVGIAAVFGALGYSGGPAPYGARGLGEIFVFVFFGLVAVAGSAYVQAGTIPARAWWAAVPTGLLAVAVLVANNLRDIPTDTAAGKRTLAVRLGDPATRALYALIVIVSYLVVGLGVLGPLSAVTLIVLITVPMAIGGIMMAQRAKTPPQMVSVLLATVRLHLVFGLGLALGMWLR